MRKLILIKHPRTLVEPEMPSSTWKLSEEGLADCPALAEALRPYGMTHLVSSTETKAQETAKLLSEALSVPWETGENLQEHDRDSVPHMATREFLSLMAMVFTQPKRKVLGNESADRARDRFLRGLDATLDRHPEGNIGVISHGTVIALAIEYYRGDEAYPLWRRMGLPSFVVLEVPGYQVLELTERIG